MNFCQKINPHQKHFIRLILIIIAITFYFLANIQRVAVPGAVFDLLQGDLSTTAPKITMLGAVFCYVYALSQLITGILVDKVGGFKVALFGIIAFTFGALLFPKSDNFFLLYLSRAFLGFGSATFYLSSIREVKKYVKDENFSLAVSYMLFVGYSGGIIANAPLVSLISVTGWRNAFLYLGYFAFFIGVLYLILFLIFKPVHCDKKVEVSISPFKEILTKKENIYIYVFGGINYGLYYVLQSVIGKKFLQDFCFLGVNKSALILSFMAVVAAFAGVMSAWISKKIGNKRAVIFRIAAIFSSLSTLTISLFLFFDIHSNFITVLFLIIAYFGSISPLLICTLHLLNRYEISATAVAIQSFNFFMIVGILGAVSGMLMHLFEPTNKNGVLIYPNESYLCVFVLFFVLSLISLVFSFKIKDTFEQAH